jgi:hypothetical protein
MPFLDDTGLKRVWSKMLDKTHPVGSLYWSSNSTNPGKLFGGTWVQIKDKFILAAGDKYGNGTTGGSADAVVVSHTHSIPKLSGTATGGNHRHDTTINVWTQNTGYGSINPTESGGANKANVTVQNIVGYSGSLTMSVTTDASTTGSQGVSGAGKNMPPYETYYCWKRTA